MRLLNVVLIFGMLNLVGCVHVPNSQQSPEKKDVTWRFVAHRGANNAAPGNTLPHYPENTLVSLREAFAKGAHYAECDVHLTRDKKIVVLHDDSLRRTARYNPAMATTLTEQHFKSILDKKIPELSFDDELSQVDVGYYADYLNPHQFRGTRIPLLEDFLQELKGHPQRRLVVELKAGDQHIANAIEKMVPAYVKSAQLQNNQILFISFDFELIKTVKKLLPSYQCLFLTIATPDPDEGGLYYRIKNKKDLDHIIHQVKEAGLDGLDVEFDPVLIDVDFMQRIHHHGLMAIVWNYTKDDTLETAKHLLKVNADLINTNQPEFMFKQLIGKF